MPDATTTTTDADAQLAAQENLDAAQAQVIEAEAAHAAAEGKTPRRPRASRRAVPAVTPAAGSAGGAPRAKRALPFQGKPAPKGYVVRWSGAPIAPATDYLKAEAKDTDPAWLVRCNAHGTTSPARSVQDCKKVGTRAARLTWCPQCADLIAQAAR